MIDQIITDDDLERIIPTETSYPEVPGDANGIASILTDISPMLDDKKLCNLLHARADLGQYQSAIGSTNATTSQYVHDTVDAEEKNEPPSADDKNILLGWLHDGAVNGTLDLDA
eukprot:7947385-Ditylum_brightwellii.AAC.1